ncbi:MAG TPA: flagellar hook-basal body complex protein FliE [Phycisphaerae bacterium]|nr:flagellar hook-basal body complex protein FliE [Phycisphaerae bacterium]
MSAINPISNVPASGAAGPASSVGRQSGESQKVDFGQMLKGALDKVSDDQAAATFAVQDLIAGNMQDVLPAVTAAAKADMSFKLLIGIRNKVIEAYKQTMSMQI